MVSGLSSITLSDEEKLDVLRRLDQFRQWHSLDQKRYCLVCGEMITGREIQVIESAGGRDPAAGGLSNETLRCNADRMGPANRGCLDKDCNG